MIIQKVFRENIKEESTVLDLKKNIPTVPARIGNFY